MSILHIAVFEWFDTVTDEQVQALCEDLAKMPTMIEGVRSYRFGKDLGLREGNFDFGVAAELDGPDDIHRYLDHPLHQELVAKHIVNMVAKRRAVQIALGELPGETHENGGSSDI